jgi:hypothetical protein
MTTTDDTANPASSVRPDASSPDDEFVPDYSRLGFRDLRKLCTAREIPADGTVTQLIEKLKAADAAKGLKVDDVPDDDEFDLLADEQPTAAGGGGPVPAASAAGASPPAAARPSATDDLAGPAIGVAPEVGTTPEVPAVRVISADTGEVVPRATLPGKAHRPDLGVQTGRVKVGEASGAAAAYAFRWAFVIGNHDVSDNDHFVFLAETHAQAAAAGHATKGGQTVGERIGYAYDADHRRVAIYQVPLKRQK